MIAQLPILQTPRLILSPLGNQHLDLMMALERDPEVMRYIGAVRSETEIAEHCKKWISNPPILPGLGTWAVAEKAQPDLALGFAFFSSLPDTNFVELGYRYGSQAWGRGIATEAATAALRQGFECSDLDLIAGVTDHDNRASQKILSKIGLTRRDDIFAYGETLPFFSMTRVEWNQREQQ